MHRPGKGAKHNTEHNLNNNCTETMETLSFHWADYLVFGLSLATSLAIGLYFGYTGRKDSTTENFLMGNRRLFFVPVGFSIAVSIANGVSIIGIPAEMFYFGPVGALGIVMFLPIGLVLCFIFVPVIHRLKLTNAYEYFDRRYNFPPLRIAMSVIFMVLMILFLAIVLYAPALAFSEVTGLSMVASILSSGIVCTIYTAVGGLKAVVWTDTLQMAIMVIGQMVLIVVGMYNDSVGGPSGMFDRAQEGNRLDFGVWDIDPRVRSTVWTNVIGASVIWTSVYSTNQMTLQRIMAVKTVREAQYAVTFACVSSAVYLLLTPFMAWVMYAYYFECHPLKAGTISRASQLVPRFLMEILGHLHGLPGLFTAAVFAAALSSVSSALNSLAAVILEDFLKPLYNRRRKKEMSDRTATNMSKVIAICFGMLTVGMSLAADYVAGDHLFEIISTVWGTIAPSFMGVFLLGFFVPWSNGLGCLIGMLVSLILTLWMGIGGIFYGTGRSPLPPLGLCLKDDNVTMATTISRDVLQYVYDISYNWYGVVGLIITLAVGMTVSLLSLCWTIIRGEEIRPVEPDLMFKWARSCCCGCCASCKKHENDDDSYHEDGDVKEAGTPLLDIKFGQLHQQDSCRETIL